MGASIPSFRSLGATKGRQHATAGKTVFFGNLLGFLMFLLFLFCCLGNRWVGLFTLKLVFFLDLLLFGAGLRVVRAETVFQTRIILLGADGVGRRQVRRLQPVFPWNPRWCEQSAFHGNERGLAHRPNITRLIVKQRHRPLPVLIPRHCRFKTKIGDAVAFVNGFDEITDLRLIFRHEESHVHGKFLGIDLRIRLIIELCGILRRCAFRHKLLLRAIHVIRIRAIHRSWFIASVGITFKAVLPGHVLRRGFVRGSTMGVIAFIRRRNRSPHVQNPCRCSLLIGICGKGLVHICHNSNLRVCCRNMRTAAFPDRHAFQSAGCQDSLPIARSLLNIEIVGNRTQHHSKFMRFPRTGIVTPTQSVASCIQQFDEIFDDCRHVFRSRAGRLHHGRQRLIHRHGQRLRTTAAISYRKLHFRSLAQCRDALRQCRSREEHVLAFLRLNKSITLFLIKPTHTSARHSHLQKRHAGNAKRFLRSASPASSEITPLPFQSISEPL